VAERDLTNTNRQRSIRLWIIGLTLLALLLAGIALALRGPVAVGVDDGTSPAGNIREPTDEPTDEPKNEVPRSLRQYAAAPRPILEYGRVDSSQRMC
jgi:hypothetical protein